MIDEILKFLKEKEPKLCCLATVSKEEKPECAVMGYAVLDDLSFILSTDNTSRKHQNLKTNQHVSLVFGWTFEGVLFPVKRTKEFRPTFYQASLGDFAVKVAKIIKLPLENLFGKSSHLDLLR